MMFRVWCVLLVVCSCCVSSFQLKRFAAGAAVASSLMGFGQHLPALADGSREVASIATSGIIFKDTLKINAFPDPKVQGVVIYLADFERPLTEKLQKDFFDDPSSTSLACSQSGPIKIGDISTASDGEEVFEANRNLFFKQIRVRRVYDKVGNNLVYTSFSTRFDKGNDNNKSRFKSSICAVHVNNN
jgi:catabolite regulation protein CreA